VPIVGRYDTKEQMPLQKKVRSEQLFNYLIFTTKYLLLLKRSPQKIKIMKLVQSIPGYHVNEYLLVLSPHEELRNKIMKVKESFADEYKTNFARKSKPHITLVNFLQYGITEERILHRLHALAMGFQPFKVELKDYGSFPAHTIYLNVTSKLPIQNLVKQIRTDAQKLMKLSDDNKPHFIMEPHLTIGRKLQPWQYEKGWLNYSHRNFTGRFIADGMLLLKKRVGDLNYQVVNRFAFENLAVTTKQGALFM
jgi:2'-5' RNA ligase